MFRVSLRILGSTALALSLVWGVMPSASALSKSTNSCAWDLGAGWVARENAKAGYSQWDHGIPIEYAGDFAGRENRKKRRGGPFSSWLSPSVGGGGPEGWFSSLSATCGESVAMHISGNGDPVTIRVFRMGYYGGAGARLIEETTTKSINHYSAGAPSNVPKSTVKANWPIAWAFTVSSQTPPGQYLVRLDDKSGDSNLVPLMVTNPDGKNPVTFVSSVLTWQAYNEWGGFSLYKGPNGTRRTRAMVVSFDRPYDGDGAGQFRYMEFPVLRLAEKLGIDLNYLTDIEVDMNAPALSNGKSIVFGGHGEYWTTRMRDAIDAAVAKGINLVSFGGNAAYNRPRLEGNNRELVMWRSDTRDPNRKDPALATTRWRAVPINRPEASLFGAQYVGLGVNGDYTIAHPMRWPFTVMKHSASLKGVVGREVDSPLYAAGPAVEDLAWAEIKMRGRPITAMATYYNNAKSAGIIDISTNGWTCAIDDVCPWSSAHFQETQADVQLITEEILKGLSKGPLGLWRPAIPDIAKREKGATY